METAVEAGGVFQEKTQSRGEGEMPPGKTELPREKQSRGEKQPQGGMPQGGMPVIRMPRLLPRPLRVIELGCGVAPAAGMACLGVGCDVLFTDLPQVRHTTSHLIKYTAAALSVLLSYKYMYKYSNLSLFFRVNARVFI